QDFRWMIDLARPRDIRDVDHSVETIFQFHKSAVTGEVADLAFDAGAGWIFVQRTVPWIRLKLAHAERNLLLFAIDAQHDGFDFLIRLEHVGWFGDAFGPGQFGDVHETFDTRFKFDEGTVRDEVNHAAFDLRSNRILLVDIVPRIAELLLQAQTD